MKLKIQPFFLLYGLSIAVFSSGWACVAAMSALLVHEAAHLAVGRIIGEKVESIEFTPFGGVIRYPSGVSPQKGVRGTAMAAAGPLANYVVLWLMSLPEIRQILPHDFVKQAILMNAGMMLLNLLPVLPLDGGRIVLCIGYYWFPIGALTTVLAFGGMAVGALMMGIALYGASELGKLNVSLLLVGGYLAVYACRNRVMLLSENVYALLQERLSDREGPTAARVYCVRAETKLLSLLGILAGSRAIVFRVAGEWLDERQVVQTMLQNADATVGEALKNTNIFDENAGNDLKHVPL